MVSHGNLLAHEEEVLEKGLGQHGGASRGQWSCKLHINHINLRRFNAIHEPPWRLRPHGRASCLAGARRRSKCPDTLGLETWPCMHAMHRRLHRRSLFLGLLLSESAHKTLRNCGEGVAFALQLHFPQRKCSRKAQATAAQELVLLVCRRDRGREVGRPCATRNTEPIIL